MRVVQLMESDTKPSMRLLVYIAVAIMVLLKPASFSNRWRNAAKECSAAFTCRSAVA
jgi:hypothetical protein